MSAPRKFLFYILLFLLSQCTEDPDLFTRDYPIIVTEEVTNISPEGALFRATVLSQGQVPIDDHGFVWGIFGGTLDIDFSERKSLGPLQGEKFEAAISSTLETDKIYHVRCYVKVGTKEIYGTKVFFTSLGSKGPQIISFSPTEAKLLDTLLIVGKNFSYLRHVNIVKMNEINADIFDVTDTLIKVQIPIALEESTASVSVSVQGNKSVASEQLKLKAPSILAVSKNKIRFCDTLSLTISPVHPSTLSVMKVFFNESSATPFKIEGNNKISVRVPAIPPNNLVAVKLKLKKAEAVYQTPIELKVPSITSADSSPKTYGDTITFNADYIPECNLLAAINGSSTPYIKTPGKNTIKVIVPYSVRGSEIKATLLSEQFVLTENTFKRYVKIESIVPRDVTFGQRILVTGKGFHPDLTQVKINDKQTQAHSFTSSGFYIIMPHDIDNLGETNGLVDIEVTVDNLDVKKVNAIHYLPPEIISMNYSSEYLWFEIEGRNLNFFSLHRNKIIVEGGGLSNIADYGGSSTLIFRDEVSHIEAPDKFLSASETGILTLDVNGQRVSTNTVGTLNYTGPWKELLDFPGEEREGGIIFELNEFIYFGLGKNSTGEALKDFWKYSATANEWTKINDFAGPARFDATIFDLHNSIHLAFGQNSNGLLNDVWTYNPFTDMWTQMPGSPAGGQSKVIALVFDYKNEGTRIVTLFGGTLGSSGWGFDGSNWEEFQPFPVAVTHGTLAPGETDMYVFNSILKTAYSYSGFSGWQEIEFDVPFTDDTLFTNGFEIFAANKLTGGLRGLAFQDEYVSRLPNTDQPLHAIQYHYYPYYAYLIKGTKLFSFDWERYNQVR